MVDFNYCADCRGQYPRDYSNGFWYNDPKYSGAIWLCEGCLTKGLDERDQLRAGVEKLKEVCDEQLYSFSNEAERLTAERDQALAKLDQIKKLIAPYLIVEKSCIHNRTLSESLLIAVAKIWKILNPKGGE